MTTWVAVRWGRRASRDRAAWAATTMMWALYLATATADPTQPQRVCAANPAEGSPFSFCYEPADAPMIDVAAHYLVAAERELTAALGGGVSSARIELVTSAEQLAVRSGVPLEDILATQTAGIARDGVIVLISPRTTIAGYRWLDTLVHELVHLHLAELGGAKIPVWLQEGIARYYERIWQQPAGGRLRLDEVHLIADALRRGMVPDIEGMRSFAAAGDRERGRLAYALALSYVQYLVGHRPAAARDSGLRRALALLAEGAPLQAALTQGLGAPPHWRASWRRGFSQRVAGTPRPMSISAQALAHQRLAQMLRDVGELDAAAIELRQAMGWAAHPALTIGLADVLVAQGQPVAALALLRPLWGATDDLTLAPVLGRAAWRAGDAALARQALQEALATNPFDAEVRCALADVYATLRHPAAARERAACQALTTLTPR